MFRRKKQEASTPVFQQLINKLKLLGTIRDGVLVSGAIFYAAGYLVWSIHAWLNNMGFLPALDFQYFVAGCIPVLIILIAYFSGRFLWNFIMKIWPQKVSTEASGGWRIVRLTLSFLFPASLFCLFFMAHPSLAIVVGLLWVLSVFPKRSKIQPYDSLPARGKTWRIIGTLGFLTLFIFIIIKGDAINSTFFGFVDRMEDQVLPFLGWIVLLIVLFLPTPEKDWLTRVLKVFYFALTLLLFPLIGLFYYALEIYPNWPQELGGVQPRCAYVDVSPVTLSTETRVALLPELTKDTTLSVIRSRRLDVLFTNDTYLLVKTATQEQNQKPIVYELKKNNVLAITWCE